MIVRMCAVLLFALLVVPFGVGEAFINARDKRLVYFGGLFASLTVFEILMLIFHAAMGSLRVMTALWCLLCGAVAVYGWCKYGRSVGKNGLASVRVSLKDWTWTEKLLLAVCLGLVALQIANMVFNVTYKNWDDETYCANAVGAVYTDLVNRVAPESGVLHPAFYNKKYVIAGWPIYSSMLSVLSGVHAAIIYRTILPIFEMALAYYLLYSLLRHFLRDDRRKALMAFVFVYQFFLLAAKSMAQFSNEWWLLVNSWTGKALAFNVVTPLVLWLILTMEDTDPAERKGCWQVLLVVGCGACLIAASLFMTLPVLFAVWGLSYCLRHKDWSQLWKFALCAAPTAVCALITLR